MKALSLTGSCLLPDRVQLPRSSQRGHLATNAFSLEPQLAVARQVVAVPVANRLAVPRSIYTVQETTTVFMALFPLLYSQLADADGEAGEHESGESRLLGLPVADVLVLTGSYLRPFSRARHSFRPRLPQDSCHRLAGHDTLCRGWRRSCPARRRHCPPSRRYDLQEGQEEGSAQARGRLQGQGILQDGA